MSTRRDFFSHAAIAAAAARHWKILAPPKTDPDPTPRPLSRTVFFNLAHEADAHAATYYLVGGGRRYPLRSLRKQPGVLDMARAENVFLQNVPDASVTHFIRGFVAPEDALVLHYVVKNDDTGTGRWSMSSILFQLPLSSVRAAHAVALSRGPLPLSAKRRLYPGMAPAVTEQDFVEEESLKDATDHATALLALHPGALSVEPVSGAHIQKSHIQGDGETLGLALTLMRLGEAQPKPAVDPDPGKDNATGWATLRPLPDPDNTQPPRALSGSNKGLILYTPTWHPDVKTGAIKAADAILPKIRNDSVLVADLTAPIEGTGPAPGLSGRIRPRRDGITRVDQPPVVTAQTSDAVNNYTLTPDTPFNGYQVTAKVTSGGADKVEVELTFQNWYIRWLGLWLEFLDEKRNVIPVAQLPEQFSGTLSAHTDTAILFGTLSPEWTIYGIPLERATTVYKFEWPNVASSARLLASGLGYGPHDYRTLEIPGTVLTVMFNLLVPTVLLAVGASQNIDLINRLVVIPLVVQSIKSFVTFTIDAADAAGFNNILAAFWKAFVGQVGKQVPAPLAAIIGRFYEKSLQYINQAEFEDAIPIAGEIATWIGILGAVAEITEATADIMLSPSTYVSELTLTHDVRVTIKPDIGHNLTPAGATECVVTALFDSGATPRVTTIPLSGGKSEVPVLFQSVPRGGMLAVSGGFYDPAHSLLGKAESGLVSNISSPLAPIVTVESLHPITPSTKYRHNRKTLDDGTGKHIWDATSPAPTENAASALCQSVPGSLCRLRAITVHQGTAAAPGYVGYAWNGFGTARGGGSGVLDRLSNLNTGDDAESGYATVPYGLDLPGARIAYSLLGQTKSNFYVDPDTNLIRRVQLDQTPVFGGYDVSGAPQAWGKLNFDSSALLLHPTGILVSVSEKHHRLETLKVPDAPVSDAAGAAPLANIHAGQGALAGSLDTPKAAAVSPDGVILVLEGVNNRIQAFDIGGNAVPFFKKQGEPYFLSLTETAGGDTVYLDVAVEHTGLIYVLSYNQGQSPFAYRLDVYVPDQTGTGPISTTTNFNAGRVAVDFWRTVYALNYEPVKRKNGTFPALTEPSVSEWVPQS